MSSDEKTIRDLQGWTRIYFRTGLDSIDVKFSERDKVRDAWKRGEAFVAVFDMFGVELDIKLGEVVALGRVTPEQAAASEADDDISRRKDSRKKLFNGED